MLLILSCTQACIKRKCEAPIEALDNVQAEEEEYFEGDEEVPKNKSVKKVVDEDEGDGSDDEKENNKNKKSG